MGGKKDSSLSRLIKAFVSDAVAGESAVFLCWDVVFTLKSHQWVFSGRRPPSFKCCNRNKCVHKPDRALQRTSGFHSFQIQFSPMEFRFHLIKICARNSIRSKDVVVGHFIFKKKKKYYFSVYSVLAGYPYVCKCVSSVKVHVC